MRSNYSSMLLFFIALNFISCNQKFKNHSIQEESKDIYNKVLGDIDNYDFQAIIIDIENKDGNINFSRESINASPDNYFYPASTVKLPIAILALQRCNEIPEINMETPFIIEGENTRTTISNEIQKIFAISDNQAFNRLFNFMGQDYINTSLKSIGIENVQISHRLSVPNSDALQTDRMVFYIKSDSLIFPNRINKSLAPLKLNKMNKGKAYYSGDSLVKKSMNFQYKNYYSLEAMVQTLKRIFFPGEFQKEHLFNLSTTQLDFLKTCMSKVPRQLGYSEKDYPDNYGKFLMIGDRAGHIPDELIIFNKVGYAYGQLTDMAYIINRTTGQEKIICATIYVNEDGILNDDEYEYQSIGIPFLAAFGREQFE